MPNGGRSYRVPEAVTVLGLGGAGCRMLDAVADRASELEGGTSFEFVAVDTTPQTLESPVPEGGQFLELGSPTSTFEADVENRHYLDAPTELHPTGGVARERSTGRYLLDCQVNFDDTVSALQTTLDEHAERAGATAPCTHHVWVLHALGGGTGSAIAPTVFGLLDDLFGEETLVLGMGSLPRLDRLEETNRVPPGDSRLYFNAHATLRELRVLFGLEGEYPHTLELGEDYGVLVSEELTVDAPPVAAYGLLGVDESHTDSDTLDALNDAVAELVCGAARSRDLLGSFLGHYPYHDETTLFTLDRDGVHPPAEELRRYAELGAERDEIADETAALESEVESLEAARDRLSTLLDRTADEDGPLDDAVETALVARVRSVDPVALDETVVDDAIDEVAAELAVPSALDPEVVATSLVSQDARENLAEAHREHSFPDEVERVADRYERQLDGPVAAADRDPLEAWEETLEPLIRQRLKMLESEREHTFFLSRGRLSELKSKVEDTRERYERLERMADAFERLRRRRDAVTERYETARAALEAARHDAEERLESTRASLESRRERARQIESTRDSLETRLTDAESGGERVLPVTADAFDASPSLLDSLDSLADWLDRGLVDPATLVDGFERTLDRLDDRVQDRQPRPVGRGVESHLSLAVAGGDVGFLEELTAPGYFFDDVVDRFDEFSVRDGTDPFALSALATFSPVHLENTSEFGTIHEHYTDPDRVVGSQFGIEGDDEVVTESFAYPELLDAADSTAPSGG